VQSAGGSLSAVIIACNEERRIAATLKALDFCDEIVVVDSGSTDATVSICKQFNCALFSRAFDGYGTQKKFAVSKASNDWILAIDADEVVTEELKREIVSVLSDGITDVQGYYIPISLVFLGRLLRFGGEYKKPHLRLFNRRVGTFTSDRVHEHAEIQGKKGFLKNHILHYSYDGITDYLAKFNEYTTIAADTLFQKGRRGATVNLFVRFPLTFFKIYFLKGCILDGYRGFLWSLFSSLYPVVKFAKLLEKQTSRQ
jgi:glycosyltransferase involved in cell wall biosynthesis